MKKLQPNVITLDEKAPAWVCDPPAAESEVGLEPFPLVCLPEPAAHYAEAVAATVGCPVDYPAACTLVAMGLAIGGAVRLEAKPGWEVQSNLYLALVGPSGSGKSPALSRTLRPLRAMVGSDPRRDIVTSGTVEALALTLRENPAGVLFEADELSALFDSFGAYRSGRGSDRQFFMSAWSGESISVVRVNRGHGPRRPETIHVECPFLSIVGGVVPERLDTFLTGGTLEDGLFQRFPFVQPRAGSGNMPSPDRETECLTGYRQLLERLIRRSVQAGKGQPQRRVRQWTPGSEELFRIIEREYSTTNGDDPSMELYGRKLFSDVARLSLILHEAGLALGDTAPEFVHEESLWSSYQMTQYFLSQYRHVQQQWRSGTHFARCLKLVHAALENGGSITLREVYTRHIAGVRTADEATQLFTEASRHGLGRIVRVRSSKGGKDTVSFRLHQG